MSLCMESMCATELTADLSADAVSSEVIAERVSVAVALLADVADQLLCVVCQHVHAEGRLVGELLRTEVTIHLAVPLPLVLALAVDLCHVAVPRQVQAQVALQVLQVGESLETGEAGQLLPARHLQLGRGQAPPGPGQKRSRWRLPGIRMLLH